MRSKKLIKRGLAVFLSALTMLSSLSAFPMAASAASVDKVKDKEEVSANLNRDASLNKYLFAYFLGEQDTYVRLAVSDDGYNFEALNGNQPLLNTRADDATAIAFNGKTGMPCSGGARDPYIIRKINGDGFWIVATDLDTSVGKTPDGSGGNTYNNSKLLIWDVKDITNVANVKPWAVDTSGWFGETYYGKDTKSGLKWKTNDYYNHEGVNVNYCAWAPEVIWDTDKNMYMIYWSNGYYDDLRIYYAYTNDFKTYYKADGTELNGTNGAEPEILYDPGVKSIDGDITYDKASGKYYMFFKKEAEGQLYIVTADHASGPYSNERKFVDNNVTGVASGGNGIGMEGPEVYQLLNGDYVFFADVYTSNNSMFQFYTNSDLSKISGEDYCGDKMVMNHLKPRHAGMAYITTDEYNSLKNTYGVARFDSSGIEQGENINDHLVAQYFTTTDVTQDATGNGNTLSNHGATYEARTYNDQTVSTVKTTKTDGSYLDFSTANLKSGGKAANFNVNDGVTLSWNSYSENDNNELYHWVFGVLGNGVQKGTFSGEAKDNANSNYLGFCANNVYTVSGGGYYVATYQADTNMDGAWHKYVMTLTKNCIVIYKDNKLYQAIYAQNCTANDHNGKATPYYVNSITNSWVTDLFTNGTLLIGGSAYADDGTFTGNIYDFRIYNKAITNADVARSTALMNTQSADEALNSFEKMMNSGTIYMNMAPTYDAYVALKKANDVYKYGLPGALSETELENYKADLAEAVANMTKYSVAAVKQQYADAYTAFKVTDQNNLYSGYTSQVASIGLLFADTEQASNEMGRSVGSFKSEDSDLNMYYSTNVLMYTGVSGDTPRFPVAFSFKYGLNKWNTKRWVYTVYPVADASKKTTDSTEFRLNMINNSGEHTNCWYGYTTKLNYAYLLGNTDTRYVVAGESTNAHNHYSDVSETGYVSPYDANTEYFASGIEYIGTPTKTLEDYTIAWAAQTGDKRKPADATSKWVGSGTATAHTYVINYKKVMDALEANKHKLTDVDIKNFREGGLKALYQTFDDITGLDLSISKKSEIQSVADNIDAAINEINTFEMNTFQKDSTQYQAMRDQMDKYAEIENSDLYTDESKAEYKKIYEASQGIMTDLLKNGYVEDAKCQTNADAMATVLNEKLDVSSLTRAIDKKDSIQISNGDQQQYTLSSYVDGKQFLTQERSVRDDLSKLGKYDTEPKEYVSIDGSTGTYACPTTGMSNRDLLDDEIEKVNALAYSSVSGDDYYATYDACMQVYNSQDRNAFTDDYLNSSDSVFVLGDLNGTSSKAPQYDSANANMKDTAYVQYQGQIYKNSSNVDAITTKVLTALNSANTDTSTKRRTYTVTFEVYKNDQLVETVKNKEVHYYGDIVHLDASNYVDGNTCYKWEVTSKADNTTKNVSNASNTYDVRIQSDSVIRAYCTEKATDAARVNVKINSLYGDTVYNMNLSKDTNVMFADKAIIINGVTYALPKVPFYTFKGWTVNWKNYAVGDTTTLASLTSSGSVTFIANFEANKDVNQIKLDDQIVYESAAFDQKVKVSSPGAYAILVKDNGKYYVAAYGDTYEFFAYQNMDFYTLTSENGAYKINGQTANLSSDMKFTLDHKLPMVYTTGLVTGENNEKYTAMSLFSVDPAVTITEVGTLYTSSADLATDENMTFGKAGVKYLKSKQQTAVGNQYSLTVATAKDKYADGKMLYMRGYVKYSYQYVDADGRTCTVQCITYSDIVSDVNAF